MIQRVRRLLIGVTICGAAVIGVSTSTASAHAVLESSSPAASSTVAESPTEIVLEFSEPVASTLADIRLFDSNSKQVSIGKTVRDSNTSVVRAEVPTLTDGAYVVVWRVSSADGHPVQGAFSFEVGATSTGNGTDLVNDVVSRLDQSSNVGLVLGAFRFLAFLGFALLVGLVSLSAAGELMRSHRGVVIASCSLGLIAVGSFGNLLLQGPYATRGGWSDAFDASLIADVVSTRLGALLVVRLVVIAVIAALLLWFLRSPAVSGVRQSASTLACIVLVGTFSASGHASALSYSLVSVVVDGAHLLSVGAWMGGLFVLVLLGALGFSESAEVRGEQLVQRFSRLATYLLPVAVVTGLVSAWRIVDGWSGVSDSTYGRMLVVKVGVVVMIVALGAVARVALRRNGVESIRRGIVVEAVLGITVLSLTAGLVALSPVSSGSRDSASVTLTQNDYIANVTFAPTAVGLSQLHVIVTPPGGSLSPVVNISARISLPAKNIPAIPVQMASVGTNHWAGVVQVPYPGDWSLQVLVKPDANSVVSFTTTVRIKS